MKPEIRKSALLTGAGLEAVAGVCIALGVRESPEQPLQGNADCFRQEKSIRQNIRYLEGELGHDPQYSSVPAETRESLTGLLDGYRETYAEVLTECPDAARQDSLGGLIPLSGGTLVGALGLYLIGHAIADYARSFRRD